MTAITHCILLINIFYCVGFFSYPKGTLSNEFQLAHFGFLNRHPTDHDKIWSAKLESKLHISDPITKFLIIAPSSKAILCFHLCFGIFI